MKEDRDQGECKRASGVDTRVVVLSREFMSQEFEFEIAGKRKNWKYGRCFL